MIRVRTSLSIGAKRRRKQVKRKKKKEKKKKQEEKKRKTDEEQRKKKGHKGKKKKKQKPKKKKIEPSTSRRVDLLVDLHLAYLRVKSAARTAGDDDRRDHLAELEQMARTSMFTVYIWGAEAARWCALEEKTTPDQEGDMPTIGRASDAGWLPVRDQRA